MTRGFSRAERVVAHLRWVVMGAAIVTLWPHLPLSRLAPLLLWLAAYSALAYWLVWTADRTPSRRAAAGLVSRGGDLALATAAVLMAPAPNWAYHALYVFPVVATGYVWPQARAVALCAGSAAVLSCAAARTGPICAGSLACLAAAATWGWFLGRERLRADDAAWKQQRLENLARLSGELRLARAHAEAIAPPLAEAVRVVMAAIGAEGALLFVRPVDDAGDPPQPGAPQDAGSEVDLEQALGLGTPGDADRTLDVARQAVSSRQPVLLSGDPTGATVCVPLLNYRASASGVAAHAIGALVLTGPAGETGFGDTDVALAEVLGVNVSFTLVHHGLYTRLKDNFFRTVRALGQSLEARGHLVPGHGEGVAKLCEAMGRSFGLTERIIGMMREAAVLHDIGKIALPDAVLSKPGSLTPDEWELIRTYPAVSEAICRPLGLDEEVLFLIRHHMERLDGSGYPDGLSGQRQPLPLRILGAAVAFQAMGLARPDRPALPPRQRLNELGKRAGIEFDEQVVNTLRSLIGDPSAGSGSPHEEKEEAPRAQSRGEGPLASGDEEPATDAALRSSPSLRSTSSSRTPAEVPARAGQDGPGVPAAPTARSD